MKLSVITSSLALVVLGGISQQAAAICTVTGNSQQVIQLQVPNITVGRDVPLGTRLYRQEFSANTSAVARCTFASGRLVYELRARWIAAPLRLSSWNTGPLAGRVYESGVQGIGVAFNAGGVWLPTASGAQISSCGSITNGTCTISMAGVGVSAIDLIKIGDVVGSGVISGNTFSTYEHLIFQDGVSSPYLRSSFSGTINVVSRTCQTPDVQVDMGVHPVSTFNQADSATPWKNFSIALNNCPAFYGTNPVAGGWSLSPNTSNIPATLASPHQDNSLQVNLTGTVPAIDGSRGILALNPAGAGAARSATGVGVQLANSDGVPVRIGPNAWIPSGITTQARDGASYTIPLKARYLRTSGPMGPGQANATVQFTINYQ